MAHRYLEIAVSMFGSNDDKKTPAPAGEKKGLFGWLRKKPQEAVVEQPPFLLSRLRHQLLSLLRVFPRRWRSLRPHLWCCR